MTRWLVVVPVLVAASAVASCSASTTSTPTTTSTATSTTTSARSTSSADATSSTTDSVAAGDAGSTTEDPFAAPAKVFTAKDTSISVATGDRFGIDLPQDPAAGSWSFTQKAGPVQLVSGGSQIKDDGTEVQEFILKATEPGSAVYTVAYSGGQPPGVPATLDVTITVT